jgi:hypothetical protein
MLYIHIIMFSIMYHTCETVNVVYILTIARPENIQITYTAAYD